MTEKDLLLLAGKLAIASEEVLKSTIYNVSFKMDVMRKALNEYNNAIMDFQKEKSQ